MFKIGATPAHADLPKPEVTTSGNKETGGEASGRPGFRCGCGAISRARL